MTNSTDEFAIYQKLKPLENKIFNTKTALFDALADAGVQLTKGYRTGSNNKKGAEKVARCYVEFTALKDIDPDCGKKSAQIITKVYDTPLPPDDGRGKAGTYITCLKSLILATADFKGQPYELFDRWGVFEKYKQYYLKKHSDLEMRLLEKGRTFNPWYVSDDMVPGLVKYKRCMSHQNKETLKRALDSLKKEEEVEWKENLYFIPSATNGLQENYGRTLSQSELYDNRKKREEYINTTASTENCVLDPELILAADTWENHDLEDYRDRYYMTINRKPHPLQATEAEIAAYTNYQEFVRQCTYSESQGIYEGLCEREDIPNAFQIFSNYKYNVTYKEFDETLLKKILGWEKAWTDIEFHVTSNTSNPNQSSSLEKAQELATKYTSYMDGRMDKETFWLSDEFADDAIGHIGRTRLGYYTLNRSKSANELHDTLKGLYLKE